jgi:hypothetical protein
MSTLTSNKRREKMIAKRRDELTEVEKEMIARKAVMVAERNLITGNWKVETAQCWLMLVNGQPEDFQNLIR